MRAIGLYPGGRLDWAEVADPRDRVFGVKAVGVNAVDVKQAPPEPGSPPRILGHDAAGVVERVGRAVSLFAPGDRVYYAGSIARPGSFAERHLVDERIAGPMPA